MGRRLHDVGMLALCGKTGAWVGVKKSWLFDLGRRKAEAWALYLRLSGW